METWLTFANWLLPLAYLALVIDYGATFVLRTRAHVRGPWVVVVIVFHALFLTLWGIHSATLPLSNIYEILSVIALSSAILYCGMEFLCRDRRAGVFVLLLIFLFQYTSSTVLAGAIAGHLAPGASTSPGWNRLHVIPAIFAYAAIAFAAVYALLYLVGQHNLKRHRFGLLFDRLPPLELLGRMSWYALVGGFVFITVAIITGAVLFGHMGHARQPGSFESKVIAKIITGSTAWVACLLAILGKVLGKWSVTRVSQIAVAGFLVILALLAASIALS